MRALKAKLQGLPCNHTITTSHNISAPSSCLSSSCSSPVPQRQNMSQRCQEWVFQWVMQKCMAYFSNISFKLALSYIKNVLDHNVCCPLQPSVSLEQGHYAQCIGHWGGGWSDPWCRGLSPSQAAAEMEGVTWPQEQGITKMEQDQKSDWLLQPMAGGSLYAPEEKWTEPRVLRFGWS